MQDTQSRSPHIADIDMRDAILNELANPSSQNFLNQSGLARGMHVLDVGCGMGLMTCWLARQVGPEGTVFAINDNEEQLSIARQLAQEENLNNIRFINLSALDLAELDMKFDFIYCRFLLMQVSEATPILDAIYELLEDGGIFACESAILGHEFCYPPVDAFDRWRELNLEMFYVMNKDPQTGMKLYQRLADIGFTDLRGQLFQHVLNAGPERFELLLNDLREQESAYLNAGLCTETELEDIRLELNEIVDDESYFIGYHQSCQIRAVKDSQK